MMPTQVPLSVSTRRVHPCGIRLFHERIPIFWWATEKDGDERESRNWRKPIIIHNLLVVFAQVEILFVIEEKVLRWGRRRLGWIMISPVAGRGGGGSIHL